MPGLFDTIKIKSVTLRNRIGGVSHVSVQFRCGEGDQLSFCPPWFSCGRRGCTRDG